MLVVRRRAGEALLIGDGIEIAVMEISPTRVKLGVSAPRAVTVFRKEMMSVAEDNRRAADFSRIPGGAGRDEILRALSTYLQGEAKDTEPPCRLDK